MLKFILGKSGTGKTTWIYNKLSEMSENPENKLLLLVPEQSTFQTEKDLLELFGAKKSKNIFVAGFPGLCRNVFERTGNVPINVIDDGTRAVIMSLAIEQLTEKLSLLKAENNKSVSELMLQTLVDCKKSSVSTEMLRLGAQKVEDETLKLKLNETALILDAYDAIISQSYIDPLDDLERLNNILLQNNIFDGYTLFIDSFSGFTTVQLKILRLLLLQCKDTYISLTLDGVSEDVEEIFETSHKTYKLIKNIAKKELLEIKKPEILSESKRFENDELKILANGAFRNNYTTFEERPNNVEIFSASDFYGECEYVARRIKKLIMEDGYFYSDIAVICHDTEPYRGILDAVLNKYEIPYFMDSHKNIEVKPAVRYVYSIFKIVLNNFDREDVVALLKTGLTLNSLKEINEFENYLYVWNINNSGFKSEFTQNPRGFFEKFSDEDKNRLALAEKVRKSVVGPLLKFKEEAKDKDGEEITRLLYQLMCDLGATQALQNMYSVLTDSGETAVAEEQIRLWNMIMEVLDKTVAIIGKTRISLKRYYELLAVQISKLQLSDIPQTVDSVTVTTAQRVRLSKQKASFLIGCIDGVFPATPHTSGIFSAFELKILSNNEISFGDDFSELASLESFMAYNCITSSSQKLFVSYSTSDLLSNTYKPSVIVAETAKVFPKIIMLDEADFSSVEERMWAVAPAFEECARSLSENREPLTDLYDYFSADEKYADKIKAVKRAAQAEEFVIENPENAKRLFGEDLKISASQLEKFSLCRFSYFCNYGLNIRERRKAEINNMEYGTLVHYVLEKFFKNYDKSSYRNMSEEDIETFVNKILEEYVEAYFGGSESKSAAFLYRISSLTQTLAVLLNHAVSEMAQSDFEVADCELNIGKDIPAYTLKLPDGHNIAISGKVDRVDVMQKDGVKYLRVIDYKTGTKTFKLSDILYGLNLQMLIYLYALKENSQDRYGEITPAGLLYMPATVPIISTEKDTSEDKVQKEVDKKLKMNGLLLDNIKVIEGMDREGEGKYIPVKIKSNLPVSPSSLASIEQFGKIFKKLDRIIADMGKALYGGKIQASPTIGAYDSCEYCPYDSVCAYRMSPPRNTFTVDNDEVYKMLDEESGDE